MCEYSIIYPKLKKITDMFQSVFKPSTAQTLAPH